MFADPPQVIVPPSTTLPRLWRIRDLVIGVAALAAVMAVLIVVLALAGARDVWAGAIVSLALEAAIGVLVLLLARWRGISLAALGLVAPRAWVPVAGGWVGAYGLLFGYGLILAALSKFGVDVSRFSHGNQVPLERSDPAGVVILLAVTVVLVAPVSEELFFRGLIHRGLRGYWAMPVAALVSGAAFALFHFNLSVVLPFTLVGALLAWASERSGSLWASIATHALFNGASFIATVVMLRSGA